MVILKYKAKLLQCFIWMFGQHLLQISSNSEIVKMQPFVEVTQNNLMLTTSFMHNIQTTANTVYGMAAQLQIQHRQLSVMYIQIE